MLYAGRNAVISYEPDNGELGYSRGNVRAAVEEIVRACLRAPAGHATAV